MGTTRLEAFSDGVIAVAITLLVLAIQVPVPTRGHTLSHDLGHNWPEYAAYVTSFLTIGIIWINHHAALRRLREADHSILILNLLVLMTIVILPFATALIAGYLRAGSGAGLAAAVYGGAFLVMSIAFSVLNHHMLIRRPHLLESPMALEDRRRVLRLALTGLVPYALATALAFVSPYLTLGICAVIAVFYAHPAASGGSGRVA